MITDKQVTTYILKYSLGVGLCILPIVINIIYGTSLYLLTPVLGAGMFLAIHTAWTLSKDVKQK